MKKLVSIILAFAMVLTMMPLSVFAAKADGSFYQEQMVGDVIVKVAAPEGVFPSDATLKVTPVEAGTEEAVAIGEAVEGIRDENKVVTGSYTFDIKVLDGDGEEIQPDTAYGSVLVSFAMAEAGNVNLDVDVYHIADPASEEAASDLAVQSMPGDELEVEALEAVISGGMVLVETEGFSYYVVEFSYDATEKDYKVTNFEEIGLSKVLEAVNITMGADDEVWAIESSNENVISITDFTENEELEDEDYILIPGTKGTAILSVKIGDDEDEAPTYEISMSVGIREDVQTEVAEAGSGNVGVALLNYEAATLTEYDGNYDPNITVTVPEVEDLVSHDKNKLYDINNTVMYTYKSNNYLYYTYENGSNTSLYYEYLNSISDEDGYLYFMPFSAVVESDNEILNVEAHYSNYHSNWVIDVPGHYASCWGDISYRDYYHIPDAEHDLYNVIDKELKVVFGYIIIDPAMNCGFKIVDETEAFRFCYDGILAYMTNGEYYDYIYTPIGTPIDLCEGVELIVPEGRNYTLICNEQDELDFETGAGFLYDYSSSGYYQTYVSYSVLDENGELVLDTSVDWEFYRYVNLTLPNYDSSASYYYYPFGDYSSNFYSGYAYAISDADAVEKINARLLADDYSYCYVAESSHMLEDFKKEFVGYKDGSYFNVDPSWVELVDDGGYEYPCEWDENSSSYQDFYPEYFIKDPDDDNDEGYTISIYLEIYPAYNELELEIGLYGDGVDDAYVEGSIYTVDNENFHYYGETNDDWFESYEENKSFNVEIQQGDNGHWLNQFIDAMKGTWDKEKYASDSDNYEFYAELDFYSGCEYDGEHQYNGISYGKYYNSGTGKYTEYYEEYHDLPLIVSGSLDISRIGTYKISFTPVIGGIANEDYAFIFVANVVPEREKDVVMHDANGGSELTIFKKDYTQASFDEVILNNIYAVNEYGNSLAVTYTIAGEDETPFDFNAIEEGDEYTITYRAEHQKDASVYNDFTKTLKINETTVTFSGTEDLALTAGKFTDVRNSLMSSVSAKDEAGNNVTVQIKSYGGLTTDAAAGTEYDVVYSAIHPNTDAEWSVTRKVTVQAVGVGQSVLALGLRTSGSGSGIPGNDPANFVLGKAGQGEIYFTLSYDLNGDQNGAVVLNIPYGFELNSSSLSTTRFTKTIEGSYSQAGGTTVTLTADLGTNNANATFSVKPQLGILYPALCSEDPYTVYTFTAQSFVGGKPAGDSSAATLTLVSNDVVSTASVQIVQDGVNGVKTYNTDQLLGHGTVSNYSDGNNYSGKVPYKFSITKDAGVLMDPAWYMTFKLPDGLRAQDLNATKGYYPYKLVYKSGDTVIAEMANISPSSGTNGTISVPLYTNNRYNYSLSNGMTYMDAVRAATSIDFEIYFSSNVDLTKLKINLPSATDKQVMTNSTNTPVTLYSGSETVEGYPIGIILNNGTDDLSSASATVARVSGYMSLPSNYGSGDFTNLQVSAGTEASHKATIYLTNVVANTGVPNALWNLYQNLELTVDYPYEYSPTSFVSNNSAATVYYTVSNASGVVESKQNLVCRSGNFVLDAGEYVSSVTLKWTGTEYKNWGRYNYYNNMYSLVAPIFSMKVSETDKYGNLITADKTVDIVIGGKDDLYEIPSVTQHLTVKVANSPIVVEPEDWSADKVSVTNNAVWYSSSSHPGMRLRIYTNSESYHYTNPALILVGNALPMVDFGDIMMEYTSGSVKVIGYSTSSEATPEGPWGEGQADLWVTGNDATRAALNNFNGVEGYITGVVLDLSGVEFGGRSSESLSSSYITFGSRRFWNTTPAFTDIVQPLILDEATGYKAVLTFRAGFHFDDEDKSVTINGDGVGKTASIVAGRVASALAQKDNDYFINPFAGNSKNYFLDKMELVRVLDVISSGNDPDYGSHQNCSTLFFAVDDDPTTEADEHEQSVALLSLAEGLAILGDDGNGYNKVSNVIYTVHCADGTEVSRYASIRSSATASNTSKDSTTIPCYYFDDYRNTKSYNYYAAFSLAAGEYVTSVTLNWADPSSNMGRKKFPGLSLVRTSAFPEVTRSGYELTVGEQLPVGVDMSYKGWTSPAGQLTHLSYTFTSAKISETPDKAVKDYGVSETIRNENNTVTTTVYQGTTLSISVVDSFSYDASVIRLGSTTSDVQANVTYGGGDANYNKLKYSVYYRVSEGFEYIAGSLTGSSASATYYPKTFTSDGSNDGLLVIDYNNFNLSGDDGVTFKLRVRYDVPQSVQIAPLSAAYFDCSYDIENSRNERGYDIVYVNGGVDIPADICSKLGIAAGTKCLSYTITNKVEPLENTVDAFDIMPILTAADGSVNCGVVGGSLVTTDNMTFGEYVELITTKSVTSTDWVIYIPVPRTTTPMTLLTDRTKATKSDIDVCLAGAISSEDLINATISYTYEDVPDYETLTGSNVDWLTADQVGSSWADVTAIRVQVPEVNKDTVQSITVPFAKATKTKTGTQKVPMVAYYNYKTSSGQPAYGQGGVVTAYNFGVSALNTIEIKDYYVTGTVWNDANYDGIKFGESGVSGIELVATLPDGTPIAEAEGADFRPVATSASNGTFTLAFPGTGDYIITVKKSGDYDIALNDVAGSSISTKSWADPTTGIINVTINEDGAVINGTNVAISGSTIYNVNVGVVRVAVSAHDFDYGINSGILSAEDVIALADAKCSDRSGAQGTIVVADDGKLEALNAAVEAGELNRFPITFVYETEETQPVHGEKTITVYLRDMSDEEAGDTIIASNFNWTIGTELTASNARKYSFVTATNAKGEEYSASKIKADATQLAAINAALDEENVGESYDLSLYTPNGARVTIQVTLTGTISKKGKVGTGDLLITEPFERTIGEGPISNVDVFKELAQVSGIDEDGYEIPLDELIVDQDGFEKVNNAIAGRKPGNYSVQISHYDEANGNTTTVKAKVAVTDVFELVYDGNGATSGTMEKITLTYGNDLTLAANTFVRSEAYKVNGTDCAINYIFNGWATSAMGAATYADGYEMTSSMVNKLYSKAVDTDKDGVYTATLYASWTKVDGTGVINATITPRNPLQGTKTAYLGIYRDGVEVQDALVAELVAGTDFTGSFEKLDPGVYTIKVTCGSFTDSKEVTIINDTKSVSFTEVGETSYQVSFDMNGGSDLVSTTGKVVRTPATWKNDTNYSLPLCTPESDAQELIGWKQIDEATSEETFYPINETVRNLAEAGGAVALTAVWQDKAYADFDANGGQGLTISGPVFWAYGSEIGMPACEQFGKELVGWKVVDAQSGEPVGELYAEGAPVSYKIAVPGETVTFIAVWANKVMVKFDLNGGQDLGISENPTEWRRNSNFILPTATRNNYTLMGWKAEAAVGDDTIYAPGASVYSIADELFTDDTVEYFTMIAQWKEGSYTISFDANGGVCYRNTKALAYSDEFIGKLPEASRENGEFLGWFTSEDVEVTAETPAPGMAMTLYAHWDMEEHTLEIDGVEETIPTGEDYYFTPDPDDDVIITIDGESYEPTVDENGTYIISGEDITGDVSIITKPRGENDVTLIYLFEGKSVAVIKTTKDASYASVELPVKEGYNVDGWFDEELLGSKVSGTIGDGATVLYAHKTPINYTLRFYSDNTLVEEFMANCGGEIYCSGVIYNNQNEFTKNGELPIAFSASNGVKVVRNEDGSYTSFTMPAESIDFRAVWDTTGTLKITVKNSDGDKLTGAVVKVVKGEAAIGRSVTNDKGAASFENLPYGVYEVEVTYTLSDGSKVTASEAVIIDKGNTLVTVTVPMLKVNTKVENDGINISVKNLEAAIPEAEKSAASPEGTTEIIITMSAEKTADDAEDPAIEGDNKNIKDAMDAFVASLNEENVDGKVVEYIDIDVTKTVKVNGVEDAAQSGPVKVTDDYQIIYIEVTGSIYEALAEIDGSLDNIMVLRMHEGSITKMTKTADVTTYSGECYAVISVGGIDYIVIKAKNFSTYAIAVQKAAVDDENIDEPVVYARTTETGLTGVDRYLICDDHIAYIAGSIGKDGVAKVKPEASITRAEVAQIFYNLLINKDVEITKTFSDVPGTAWYATAVNTIASLGIISGYTDGTFRPEQNITRAEFASIACGFAYAKQVKQSFSDVAEDFWGSQRIATAASYGWVTGYADGTFRPDNNITRAEAITIVNHMLGRAADQDYAKKHADELKSFPDLTDETKWYYWQIVEAVNAHGYTKQDDKEVWE